MEVGLKAGPLLDWKIRQIWTVFEHGRDVYGGMVLHCLGNAIF